MATATSMFLKVKEHLLQVTEDPSISLDEKLLDRCDSLVIAYVSQNTESYIADLLNQLSALLPTLQQDPTPATTLIETIIRRESFTFTDVLAIRPPVDFAVGLSAPSPPINLVTLGLLSKATVEASDAGVIAGKAEVVKALINLWLRTTETAVAEKALFVLTRLMGVDSSKREISLELDMWQFDPRRFQAPGLQGLMWRRILKDKDVYGLMFSLCSFQTLGDEGQLNKRQKSIAQARLLDFIKQLGTLDVLHTSQIPEVESLYGVKDGGLMDFAAVQMIDYKEDVLMHMTLMEWFTDLVGLNYADVLALNSKKAAEVSPHSTTTLDLLLKRGLHARTMSYFLEPDKYTGLELSCLYGKAAAYIAAYANHCPTHFLRFDPSTVEMILHRVTKVLEAISFNGWAHDKAPVHDLNVLASLPRIALLPSVEQVSPLFALPTRVPNVDVFRTLAKVFRGPSKNLTRKELSELYGSFIPPKTSPDQPDIDLTKDGKAAARALYFLYFEHNPNMWKDVVAAAETVALKDNALAAIGLIQAVINANWAPLPTESSADELQQRFHLMTERQLENKCRAYTHPLPPGGIQALLLTPVLEVVFPYLMNPAQTFSNLVGGRGDTESYAYKVALAKHDTLVMLQKRLRVIAEEAPELQTGSWQELIAAVSRRILHGPLGGSSEVGGRIATLDL